MLSDICARRPRSARAKRSRIVVGVGGVVEVERVEIELRDHAPHRLAQQRGAFHGVVAAPAAPRRARGRNRSSSSHRSSVASNAVVGGEIGEIEQRRVEAGIVPVDQPEPLAVVDEIGGQQIVVAEDDRQAAPARLRASSTDRQPARQIRHMPMLRRSCSVWA